MNDETDTNVTEVFDEVIASLAEMVDQHGAIETESATVAAARLVLEDSAPERRAMVLVVAGELVRSYREAEAEPVAQA